MSHSEKGFNCRFWCVVAFGRITRNWNVFIGNKSPKTKIERLKSQEILIARCFLATVVFTFIRSSAQSQREREKRYAKTLKCAREEREREKRRKSENR